MKVVIVFEDLSAREAADIHWVMLTSMLMMFPKMHWTARILDEEDKSICRVNYTDHAKG